MVLYDSPGDVGGSGDVHVFPVLSAGGSVYPSYGPQFSTVAAGGRRSPAVACWASDHWVASSNPLRGKFCH